MDQFVNFIGWIVIALGLLLAISKLLDAFQEPKAKKLEARLLVDAYERRIAFRKMYFSTNDEHVRGVIKIEYGPWALLELEMSDTQYDNRESTDKWALAYNTAKQNVEAHGPPFYLYESKIVKRSH